MDTLALLDVDQMRCDGIRVTGGEPRIISVPDVIAMMTGQSKRAASMIWGRLCTDPATAPEIESLKSTNCGLYDKYPGRAAATIRARPLPSRGL